MTPKKITVHCSATKNGEFVSIETIREWHIKRGFSDIGYHIVIQPGGEVMRGRPIGVKGAHVEGANTGNIGICLVGMDRFTTKQFAALRDQLDILTYDYNIPISEIWGHYQFASAKKAGKTCPNIEIEKLLNWYVSGEENAIRSSITEQ